MSAAPIVIFVASAAFAASLASTERKHFLDGYVAKPLQARVSHLIDGDTIGVTVPAWSNTPFGVVDIRIAGIDSPESHMPPGKCAGEVVKGKASAAFVKTFLAAGQNITFLFTSKDKYGARIDAKVTLPDGRDFGTVMIAAGLAAPYNGGTKQSWCP